MVGQLEPVAFALLQSGLFARLTAGRFAELLTGVRVVELDEGAWLFREGDPSDAVYVVVEGSVQVVCESPSELVLARVGPGEHFGERSLLVADRRRTASVRGAEPCKLARIEPDVFEKLVAGNPELRAGLDALARTYDDSDLARKSDLVRSLLADASTEAREVSFREGDTLVREGAQAEAMFVLLAGRVGIYAMRDGQPVRLATAGPGMCIGERGVAKRLPHSATAIALERVRALRVDTRHFADLVERSAELRDHIATLERVYSLPSRGFVTEYAAEIEGADCLTQVYHLDDRRLVVMHLVGSPRVLLETPGSEPERSIRVDPAAVTIGVASDGSIVRLDAERPSDLLSVLLERAIDGNRLMADEERSLVRDGALAPERSDVLCRCLGIGHAAVASLAESRATLAEVRARLGCGTVCGSCIPAVMQLLGSGPSFIAVKIARVQTLTADVRAFDLVARDGASLPLARPGQHVVLRATIDGSPVDRSYTLSNAPGAAWQVTVRRERGGRFSGWLFDDAEFGTVLETSVPRGNFVWECGPEPVVCFVGGIGVTPALCFVRTLFDQALPHRMVVDWSCRTEEPFPFWEEIASAAASRPGAILRRRITSREPRLSAHDVRAWATRFPSARFFVCGPARFDADVQSWLHAAGIPPAQIRVERFLPAGVAVAPSTAQPRETKIERAEAQSIALTVASTLQSFAARLEAWGRA